MLVNDQRIDPMPVITGAEKYPEGIAATLANSGVNTVMIDAAEIATECGDIRAVNIVLIGVMAGLSLCGISRETWEESIKTSVPQKALEINQKAFEKGFERGRRKCR